MQLLVHYGLHFGFIALIAVVIDKENWVKIWLILLLTMAIDLDHLFADPVYDPQRCSVGFHILHQYWLWLVYIAGALFIRHRVIKIIMIGLAFHLLTDQIDCLWTQYLN